MTDKNIGFYKYILETETPKLLRDDKIRLLTKVAKIHKHCIFESGSGTQIRLDPLPDDMIINLYNMVKKCLNL
jgi:hypothetical protein